ncbi:MAG: DUF983 domain-containing protein [Gammaproteobacteria bacterium]|nr:DUF983 domain-containing protein [Gammaproteobacteria bacterium]MYK68593.1 DUF983 domain-containing protein [Gammaproteobacteria bacterium]
MREGLPRRLQAVVLLRCPRCLGGAVFASLWKMHPLCPSCRLEYEREPGYFTGAMYVSYGLGLALCAPLGVVLMVLGGLSANQSILAIAVMVPFLAPLLFRYSRVIWMHLDQLLDPR